MTSDVAEARPLSAGSGKGQRLEERGARPDRAWTSHQTLGCRTRGLMIETLGALDGACARGDRGALGPDGST